MANENGEVLEAIQLVLDEINDVKQQINQIDRGLSSTLSIHVG